MIFILPTDTCYGLAGEFNEQDYNEIYHLKGRDFMKPLAWLVEDYVDLQKYIEITDEQIEILKKYNRPWSILGKRNPTFILPDFLNEKQYEKISLRVARVCLSKEICELIFCHSEVGGIPFSCSYEEEGFISSKGDFERDPYRMTKQKQRNQLSHHFTIPPFPLFLTSANLSDNPESTTLSDAREYFPGIDGYDGGVCNQPPSDIFSFGIDNELIYHRNNPR